MSDLLCSSSGGGGGGDKRKGGKERRGSGGKKKKVKAKPEEELSATVIVFGALQVYNGQIFDNYPENVLSGGALTMGGTRRIAIHTQYVAANSEVHIKYLVITPAVPAIAGAAVPCLYDEAQLTAAGAIGGNHLLDCQDYWEIHEVRRAASDQHCTYRVTHFLTALAGSRQAAQRKWRVLCLSQQPRGRCGGRCTMADWVVQARHCVD